MVFQLEQTALFLPSCIARLNDPNGRWTKYAFCCRMKFHAYEMIYYQSTELENSLSYLVSTVRHHPMWSKHYAYYLLWYRKYIVLDVFWLFYGQTKSLLRCFAFEFKFGFKTRNPILLCIECYCLKSVVKVFQTVQVHIMKK